MTLRISVLVLAAMLLVSGMASLSLSAAPLPGSAGTVIAGH